MINGNELIKNTYPEGSKTVTLTAKTPEAGKETEMEITIEEKKYKASQLDEMFLTATKKINQQILQENKSINEVRSNLSLVHSISDYPFSISWKSSDSSYMDESGQLKGQIIEDDITPSLQTSQRDNFLYLYSFITFSKKIIT